MANPQQFKSEEDLIPFTVDTEEIFFARPAGRVPGGVMLALAKSAKDKSRQTEVVMDFVAMVLDGDSRAAFLDRWEGRVEPPIGMPMLGKIIRWLMEEHYSPERPTEAPSPSTSGRRSIGANSTAGAPPEE